MRPRRSTRRASQQAAAELKRVRQQIDRLDGQLVRRLNQRAALAVRTSHLKRRQGRPIFDGRREQQVLRQILRVSRGPLSQGALRTIYQKILRANRSLGKKMGSKPSI